MKARLLYILVPFFLLGLQSSGGAQNERASKLKAFDELAVRVQRRERGITEKDVIQVLSAARELGCPFQAEAAIKGYSVANPDLPETLLLMAAENAFLAGDFRTSVARYKNYFEKAAPGGESSDAAAIMLTILIDFLNGEEDAYAFMKKEGGRFWKSSSARRFDLWFLEMASRKNDVAASSDRLLDVLSTTMPVEREKFFYRDHLDWLMHSLRKPATAHYPLIPALKQILPLIRADNARLASFGLVVANLEFAAASSGKTEGEQAVLFAPVVSAAKAFFDVRPTAASLQDIEFVFSSGFVGSVWQVCGKQKQDFFVYAFGKLSDDDRAQIIGWMPRNAQYLASPDQWTQLCLAHPKAFADAEQFIYPRSNHDLYKKQSQFLQGKASTYAAIVNSVAAAGDFDGMARHMIEKESWHLNLDQVYALIKTEVWPIFQSFPREAGSELPKDYYSRFLVKFGTELLLKSPVPVVDIMCAADILLAQWQLGDRPDMAQSLRLLDWIPYTEKEREAVFGASYNAFKSWVGEVRTVMEARSVANDKIKVNEQANSIKNAADAARKAAEAKAAQAKKAAAASTNDAAKVAASASETELQKAIQAWNAADKQAAQTAGAAADAKEALSKLKDAPVVSVAEISAMEEAFKAAMNPEIFNPDKAPNPLCKSIAKLLAAARDANQDDYESAGRELYAQFKDFDAKKTPYGMAVIELVMRNRLESFDTLDFQVEALAEQLTRWAPGGPTRGISAVRDSIMTGRAGWPASIPAADRPKAQKVSDVMEKTLLAKLDKKQFWPTLFTWFRQVRKGQGWIDDDAGVVVVGRMIEEKTLLNTSYRVGGATAAGTYMWLVQNEFIKLRSQYPPASYFDDMFVEECNKSGDLDFAYWTLGTDTAGKVVNMATSKLQSYSVLPLTFSEFTATNDLWRWHTQCLSMNPAWRKARNVNEQERDKLIAGLKASFGTTRFDEFAAGAGFFTSDASAASPESRAELFRSLSGYIKSAAAAPVRRGPPSLNALSNIKEITVAEAGILLGIFPNAVPARWASGHSYEKIPEFLYDALSGSSRAAELMMAAPFLWKIAIDLRSATLYRDLAGYSTRFLENNNPDLAAKFSISGLDIYGSAPPEDVRVTLRGNRMKALVGIGDTIPVDRHDVRYPVFAAQMAYLAGNLQNAWEFYLTRPDQVAGMFKDLDPEFSLWLIKMNTESQSYERADELARSMMQWLDSLPSGFDRNLQARVMIAYSDIAFSRQEFPRARALYQRIVADKVFENTRAKFDAQFRIADVDRVTRNYESAVAILEKLAMERERWIQIESCYKLAQIKFEQEDYAETARLLDYIFALDPSHVAGKLLEGKLNLQLKRYGNATDIKVGLAAAQRIIVPGKSLNIYLEDRNLSVVGKSKEIQVRVWTDSGDEEFVSLFLSSYSKTKFEGSLPSELAAISKGDRMLQVLGNDTVYYDYSDVFKKAHNIRDSQPMSMSVASDSVLLISSGELLSEEEQQEREFSMFMDQIRRAEDLSRQLGASALSSRVRPGNNIYVRVVDPDQSVTPGRDTVNVKVSAYSGDLIPAFSLTEVKPYSGVFEGEIATVRAGAMAYATDSSEGRLPVYAISTATHPWVAFTDSARPKSFSVDLNDNVMLGKMNILSRVAGRKLREFFVQVSFDKRNFRTVGRWPTPHKSWDGTPGFEFVSTSDSSLNSAERIRLFIDSDSVGQPVQRSFVPLAQMLTTGDQSVVSFHMNKIPVGGPRYVARFRASFYLPQRQTRLFRLEQKTPSGAPSWFLAVDGQGPDASGQPDVLRRTLQRGVHTLDIYFSGTSASMGEFTLMVDTDEPPYTAPCPIAMFDPVANPAIAASLSDRAAEVNADDDKSSFDIKFAPNTRARAVRLVISDYETDAPAINKITLTNADGEQILPVDANVASAGANDVLELVAGDRISVVYEDPKAVTESKAVQERFLTAEYHDGEIFACVRDVSGDRHGTGSFVQLFRFVPGGKFDVMINDADRDVSEKLDVITFSAKTDLGDPVTFKALETDKHSGRFVGSVFTITNDVTRTDELKVELGENVVLLYEDAENTDPGIPWTRTYTVEQVAYDPPELRVYDVVSIPLSDEKKVALREPSKRERAMAMNRQEYFFPTRDLIATRPLRAESSVPASIIAEGPLLVELTYPTVALASNSIARIYAQTLAARKSAGAIGTSGFDPSIPGTVALIRAPSDFNYIETPQGYLSVFVRGDPYASSPLRDGRFSFNVRKAFGSIEGDVTMFGTSDSMSLDSRAAEQILFITSDDEIFIGFQYEDRAGATNWITQRVVMTSDVFMDVMDRYYQETVNSIFVGQNLYLRVNHRGADTSAEKDAISVSVATGSGYSTNIALVETFEHSGSFRGVVKPVHSQDEQGLGELGAVPVKYGDTVVIKYQPVGADEALTRTVTIHKGADGEAIPFTKQFADPETAVRTQFTIAEAYFELAKKHRALGQASLARREIAQGRRLLEEVIKDYPNIDIRAQADYLLADLALEYADDAVDDGIKRDKYLEAINLFTSIIMTYPDSLYAPRSQYKKALAFEKMGDIDKACEEYVKLSYMYPDNELIAETIARLGTYFSTKGRELDVKAAGAPSDAEKEALLAQARAMLRTAADVFSRLAPRFPTHDLAGKALVLSGQCYMRAEDYKKAVDVLGQVVKNYASDHELVAEAMYWRGDSFMKLAALADAYREFKKLTWDYPSSKWAKFARGRLTEPALDRMRDIEMK